MTEARRTRLWDPSFKYVKQADSDIRKTFARIRREQAKQQDAKVTPIKRGGSK